jgi:NAD(P)-dependent dehydrogenase (short-subunit alcohol dehydrogenase family)
MRLCSRMTSSPLEGEIAVVTGAAGRLGSDWTRGLAGAGARVLAVDLVIPAHQTHDAVLACVADVTDRESLERAAEVCRAQLGPPTILVNGAGIDQPPAADTPSRVLEEIPVEEFRKVIDVNLVGAFQSAQVFGAPMAAAQRGSIINIGSLYATIAPDPSMYDHLPLDPPFLKPPAYGASKAGLLQLTRYLARLWGPAGVRVNMLSPGGILGGQDAAFRQKFEARTPLRRLGRPDELIGALVFLASDASSYVTGAELRVDGGFTA